MVPYQAALFKRPSVPGSAPAWVWLFTISPADVGGSKSAELGKMHSDLTFVFNTLSHYQVSNEPSFTSFLNICMTIKYPLKLLEECHGDTNPPSEYFWCRSISSMKRKVSCTVNQNHS